MKNSEIRDYQETMVITEVVDYDDYYSIGMNGSGFALDAKYGFKPNVGEEITIHTKGGTFGTIRGVDIKVNNEVWKQIFWKTDEELDAEREAWLKKNEEDKQRRFAENVDKMDAQYQALPDYFKARIDRFRANNSSFRVDFEDYELFCCEQAVIIANALKTPENVENWSNSDNRFELVPELSHDHTGNTMGCSTSLAYWYLKEPEAVQKIHGALSPLVGSKAYGDVPETNEE